MREGIDLGSIDIILSWPATWPQGLPTDIVEIIAPPIAIRISPLSRIHRQSISGLIFP